MSTYVLGYRLPSLWDLQCAASKSVSEVLLIPRLRFVLRFRFMPTAQPLTITPNRPTESKEERRTCLVKSWTSMSRKNIPRLEGMVDIESSFFKSRLAKNCDVLNRFF
jgi:hypothetical protein